MSLAFLPQSRLVVEKPLGHDRGSAEEINDELRNVFKENQIYRIDHYLGKETVQNPMAPVCQCDFRSSVE